MTKIYDHVYNYMYVKLWCMWFGLQDATVVPSAYGWLTQTYIQAIPEGYQQNKWFYGFLAIDCFAISVRMRIIIMHVIVGSLSVFELTDNSYVAVFLSKWVKQREF